MEERRNLDQDAEDRLIGHGKKGAGNEVHGRDKKRIDGLELVNVANI